MKPDYERSVQTPWRPPALVATMGLVFPAMLPLLQFEYMVSAPVTSLQKFKFYHAAVGVVAAGLAIWLLVSVWILWLLALLGIVVACLFTLMWAVLFLLQIRGDAAGEWYSTQWP